MPRVVLARVRLPGSAAPGSRSAVADSGGPVATLCPSLARPTASPLRYVTA